MLNNIYVFVRNDLGKSQKAVQSGHALADLILNNTKTIKEFWNNTLVYLDIHYSKLDTLKTYLNDNCGCYALFKEPDLENITTAISAIMTQEMYDDLCQILNSTIESIKVDSNNNNNYYICDKVCKLMK